MRATRIVKSRVVSLPKLLDHYCQIIVTFNGSIVIATQQTFAVEARTMFAIGNGGSPSP